MTKVCIVSGREYVKKRGEQAGTPGFAYTAFTEKNTPITILSDVSLHKHIVTGLEYDEKNAVELPLTVAIFDGKSTVKHVPSQT